MVVKSRREQLEDYANKSSMHALPIAILFDGLALKIFWTLVWIIGTIAATVHIYIQYQHFKTYPYDVNIIYLSSKSLTFPAVTFCNISPMKKSGALCDKKSLQDMLAFETIGIKSMCNATIGIGDVFPLDKYWKCEPNNPDIYRFQPVDFCDNGVIKRMPLPQHTIETQSVLTTSESSVQTTTSKNEMTQTLDYSKNNTHNDRTTETQSGQTVPDGNVDQSAQTPTFGDFDFDDLAQTSPVGDIGVPAHTTPFPFPYDDLSVQTTYVNNELTPSLDYGENSTLNGLSWEIESENTLFNPQHAAADDLSDLQRGLKFSPDTLLKHGFTLEDMLVGCSFNGVNCTEKHFTTKHHNKYGLCHTFMGQPTNNSHKPIITKLTGSQNGLKLLLNIQSDEYFGAIANEYGVRVAIHSPNLEAPLDRTSFNIGPGKKTGIAVLMVEIERLESPYQSNCSQSYIDLYAPYAYDTEHYTEDSCLDACTKFYLQIHCNCTEVEHRFSANSSWGMYCARNDNAEENDKENEYTKCVFEVSERLLMNTSDEDALSCECPAACHETTYQTSHSSTNWPTTGYRHLFAYNFDTLKNNSLTQFLSNAKYYENQFLTRFNNFYGIKSEPRNIKDIVAENLVSLNAYYEDLRYERIEEAKSYTFTSFLADIGGILGLYIGMSIISFIEIFEAIYLAFHYMCCAQKNNQHSQKESSHENKKIYPLPDGSYHDDDVSVTLPGPAKM